MLRAVTYNYIKIICAFNYYLKFVKCIQKKNINGKCVKMSKAKKKDNIVVNY